MKISTKGRYALRLVLDIASRKDQELVSLGTISERQGISVKYLEHICSSLCHAGILESVRGSKGGYRLVRAPKDYPVGEILLAAEENLEPVVKMEGETPICEFSSECVSRMFWAGLSKAIHEYVDNITIQDLLNLQCTGCQFYTDELSSVKEAPSAE